MWVLMLTVNLILITVIIYQGKEIRELERRTLDAFRIAHLELPDNETKVALQCYFCNTDIYEGDDYYVLNGFDCCEECLNAHFKFTAELPDYEVEIADLEYHDLKN